MPEPTTGCFSCPHHKASEADLAAARKVHAVMDQPLTWQSTCVSALYPATRHNTRRSGKRRELTTRKRDH
jgi:hypothetical protein